MYFLTFCFNFYFKTYISITQNMSYLFTITNKFKYQDQIMLAIYTIIFYQLKVQINVF